jgi:Mn2+/Fe2+ NRAMP family transporter
MGAFTNTFLMQTIAWLIAATIILLNGYLLYDTFF